MILTRNYYNVAKSFSTSAYSIGRTYELLSIGVLKRYCFDLLHRGSTGDRGIDFSGHWVLPKNIVPIIGQCKYSKKVLQPSVVRELEGVMSQHLDHLGVLVASKGFSYAAIDAFNWSSSPMMFCQIISYKRRSTPAVWKKLFESDPLQALEQSDGSSVPILEKSYAILVSCLFNSKALKMVPGISIAKRHILGKHNHRTKVEILHTSENTHNIRTVRIQQ